MVMIRQRMQKVIEDSICCTQYDFRPQRSTSNALYIIRRIQYFAEIKGTKLSMAMLDWEKAFDKIQHDLLFLALKRMGFSKHYCDVIQNCCSNPTFFLSKMRLEFLTTKCSMQESDKDAHYPPTFLLL